MIDDPIGDMFSGINRLYTEQRELAAIWLEKSLICGSGRKIRIAPGETVRVSADNKLVDADEGNPVTHKVIACFGTMYNQFEFTLIDLHTNQPLQIKL